MDVVTVNELRGRIVVENKIYAHEEINQLEGYAEWLNEQGLNFP